MSSLNNIITFCESLDKQTEPSEIFSTFFSGSLFCFFKMYLTCTAGRTVNRRENVSYDQCCATENIHRLHISRDQELPKKYSFRLTQISCQEHFSSRLFLVKSSCIFAIVIFSGKYNLLGACSLLL